MSYFVLSWFVLPHPTPSFSNFRSPSIQLTCHGFVTCGTVPGVYSVLVINVA